MKENSFRDQKSIRTLTKANPNWNEIAKDCVSFANAQGGSLIFGIEDGDKLPPLGQKIPEKLPAKLQKQIQGRTKGTSYYIEPSVLKKHEFRGKTSLKNIPSHRLDALIMEDLSRYGLSAISHIHQRIGQEIPLRKLRYQLNQLVDIGRVSKIGEKRGTKYFIDK